MPAPLVGIPLGPYAEGAAALGAVIGLAMAVIGAAGIALPTSTINSVISLPAAGGLNRTVDLAAGHYTLVWATASPGDAVTFGWRIQLELTSQDGAVLASGEFEWTESSSCSTDEDGDTSCSGPGSRRLTEVDAAGGDYMIRLTVLSRWSSDGRAASALLHFTNPAEFCGRYVALTGGGVAMMAGAFAVFAYGPFVVAARRRRAERETGAPAPQAVEGPEPAALDPGPPR